MPNTCAYCGSNKKLTREHIIPKYFYKRVPKGIGWNKKANDLIEGESTVKDVCASCNNEILSKLDNYVYSIIINSGLFTENYTANKITFNYNYHLLSRWLLKVAYNSERAFHNDDIEIFKKNIPYILGKDKPSNVIILVGMFKPHELTSEEYDSVKNQIPLSKNNLFNPFFIRISYPAHRDPSYYLKQIVIGVLCFHVIIHDNYYSRSAILTKHLTKCKGMSILYTCKNKITPNTLSTTQLDSLKNIFLEKNIKNAYHKYFS